MNKMLRKYALYAALGLFACFGIGAQQACSSDADTVSTNISTDADYFKVNRRIIFYNGITGETMLTIEGLCSRGNDDPSREVTITCKTGPATYKKHFLGLSDNVTYMIEQIDASVEDPYHYTVVWKPTSFLPNLEIK